MRRYAYVTVTFTKLVSYEIKAMQFNCFGKGRHKVVQNVLMVPKQCLSLNKNENA